MAEASLPPPDHPQEFQPWLRSPETGRREKSEKHHHSVEETYSSILPLDLPFMLLS